GESADVGLRRGLDDVCRDSLAAGQPAMSAAHHRELPARAVARADGGDEVLAELAAGVDGRLDRAEDGIDRPVAARFAADLIAGGGRDADAGQRIAPGTGLDLEPGELVSLRRLPHLVGDDRLEVERGDLLLLVRELLEPLERLVQRVALDDEAELLER